MPKKSVFECKQFYVEPLENYSDRYLVVPQDACGTVALDDENRILLTYEFRPKTQSYVWRVPAGRMESGEQPLDCARRELREESGFDAEELRLFFDYQVGSGWFRQKKYFYVARGLYASPLNTGDEVIKPEVHFKTPQEVLQMLNDGLIIDEIAAALYRFLHVQKLI